MLTINNKQVKKKYVIGGSGIFDYLIKIFASQRAKQIASSAAKEIGKAALDAGKNVAVEAGKRMVEKVMRPKTSERIEQIVNKHVTKGSAITIQDLVKKLNNSGLRRI